MGPLGDRVGRISVPARPLDFGLGDPFAFPHRTVEAILSSDFIVATVPGLR